MQLKNKKHQWSRSLVLSNSRLNRRVGLSFLYFIQGIPQGLIYFSLLDWLASKDFSISDIAIITSVASLPWILKFIIGPFIDTYQSSKMGKRKPWILSSLTLLGLIFLVLSQFISIQMSPLLIGILLSFIILSTSILDVATDGLAIDILDKNERGISNGLMWGARTFGVSISALVSSILIRNYGLNQTFIFFGIALLGSSFFIIFQKENIKDKILSFSRPNKKKQIINLKKILKDLYQTSITPVILMLILFCLVSNISFGMHYVSISNLYTNLAGWDHELLTKIRSIGLYIGIFTAIAGGYLSDKFNPYKIITMSQLFIALTMISVFILNNHISNLYIGSSILILLSIMGSFVMSASLSLCMGLSFKVIAATQFAFLMSIRHFSRIIGEWLAGLLDYLNISVNEIYLVIFLLSFLPILVIQRMMVLNKAR